MVYVDESTVRILGEVIEHGDGRDGYPVRSQYDKKRKKKKGGPWRNWKKEFADLKISKGDAEARREEVSSRIKDIEKNLKELRQQHAQQDLELTKASTEHRIAEKLSKKTGANVPLQSLETYQLVKETRGNVQETRMILIPLEKELHDAKREQYYWQKICNASGVDSSSKSEKGKSSKSQKKDTDSKSGSAGNIKMTKPTRDNPVAEDYTEALDISGLAGMDITFSGTDYGLVKMSVTVPMTPNAIEIHVNRFHALGKLSEWSGRSNGKRWIRILYTNTTLTSIECEDSSPDKDDPPAPDPPKIPKANIITAAQINQISHTRTAAARRRKRLQLSPQTQNAMESISSPDVSMKLARSTEDVDRALEAIRNAAPVLQDFESTKASEKDRHNRELRTKRAWSKVASQERDFIRDHHAQGTMNAMI
jgi:hypothetical protein